MLIAHCLIIAHCSLFLPPRTSTTFYCCSLAQTKESDTHEQQQQPPQQQTQRFLLPVLPATHGMVPFAFTVPFGVPFAVSVTALDAAHLPPRVSPPDRPTNSPFRAPLRAPPTRMGTLLMPFWTCKCRMVYLPKCKDPNSGGFLVYLRAFYRAYNDLNCRRPFSSICVAYMLVLKSHHSGGGGPPGRYIVHPK